MSDANNYIGPPKKSDSYPPFFPVWLYHPVNPARIVVDLSAQVALMTQDPLWTTTPPKVGIRGLVTPGGVPVPSGFTFQRTDTFGTNGSVANLPRLHALYYEGMFFDRDGYGRVSIPNVVVNNQQQTWQHYEDPTIAFATDHLIIQGRGQPDNSIKSAQMVSKFTSRSFVFECKITLPASFGTWASFYAYASATGNDSSELDCEMVINSQGTGNLAPTTVSLYNHPDASALTISDGSFTTQFMEWIKYGFNFSVGTHTYTIVYDDTGPGSIKRYIDGGLVYYGTWKWNQSLGGTGFGPDACMILELAVGGNFPGTLADTADYSGDVDLYYISYYSRGTAGRGVPSGQAWDFNHISSTVTLSVGDTVATATAANIDQPIWAIDSVMSGAYYWEIVLNGGANVGAGTGTVASPTTNSDYLGFANDTYGWFDTGAVYNNASQVTSWATFGTSNVRLCFALYLNPNTSTWLLFGRVGPTGPWNGSGSANPATLTGGLAMAGPAQIAVVPGANTKLAGDSATLCAAPTSWVGTPPVGYSAIP